MTQPQSGILPEASPHALFVTLRLDLTAADAARRVRAACAAFPALTAEVADLDPQAGLVSVVAIGAGAWRRLLTRPYPTLLRPFRARRDGPREAPATPGDLLLHVRAGRHDLCFELARRMRAALGPHAALVEEVAGFRYMDGRDLTGFVDGTENPEGDERPEVALVGAEDPPCAGGSYLLVQRYVHDLDRWQALRMADQEITIGRTKPDDRELPSGVKPPFAHISRVVVEEGGEELEILRHSMPYGGTDQAGLLFVAYSRDPGRFERMLDRMICADGDGVYDHLLDYTRAVTGGHYFAPSLDLLAALAETPGE